MTPHEKLLQRLAEARAARGTTPRHAPTFRVDAPEGMVMCRVCGHAVSAEELFDGICPGEKQG